MFAKSPKRIKDLFVSVEVGGEVPDEE